MKALCKILPHRKNPVRELDIPDSERDRIRHAVDKQFGGQGAQLRKGATLYADFTGHEDVEVRKVKVPDLPKELVEFGLCDGILYTTVRDGVKEKYIHKFKTRNPDCRPLICTSSDGKNLYLLGGAFTFTERGIVDDNSRH